MRPASLFAVLAVLAVTAALVGPSVASARPVRHDCRGFITDAGGAPAGVTIERGAARCATAKRVLRAYLHFHASCTDSACARSIRGWYRGGANAARYHRIASCVRGRAVTEAIAIND